MVGEEVVEQSGEVNALQEGAGENGPLKPKGNFELAPHLPELPFDIHAARSFIYRERRAVGAYTDKGRHISKFGEQMESFVKAESPWQAENLKRLLIQTERELRRLNRVRIAAPTLAIAN